MKKACKVCGGDTYEDLRLCTECWMWAMNLLRHNPDPLEPKP